MTLAQAEMCMPITRRIEYRTICTALCSKQHIELVMKTASQQDVCLPRAVYIQLACVLVA